MFLSHFYRAIVELVFRKTRNNTDLLRKFRVKKYRFRRRSIFLRKQQITRPYCTLVLFHHAIIRVRYSENTNYSAVEHFVLRQKQKKLFSPRIIRNAERNFDRFPCGRTNRDFRTFVR